MVGLRCEVGGQADLLDHGLNRPERRLEAGAEADRQAIRGRRGRDGQSLDLQRPEFNVRGQLDLQIGGAAEVEALAMGDAQSQVHAETEPARRHDLGDETVRVRRLEDEFQAYDVELGEEIHRAVDQPDTAAAADLLELQPGAVRGAEQQHGLAVGARAFRGGLDGAGGVHRRAGRLETQHHADRLAGPDQQPDAALQVHLALDGDGDVRAKLEPETQGAVEGGEQCQPGR